MTSAFDAATLTRVEGQAERVLANADPRPKVARALAAIEATKDPEDPALSECLDIIAQMVIAYGDPDLVFDRILATLQQESLRALAAANGLRLYDSSRASVDDGTVTEVVVFWPAFAIVPHGQHPTTSLDQLGAAIAERQREQQLADDFQASVAAGHVESVEEWFDRTSAAWRS